MKREVLTTLIRTAGYHEDRASFTRLYVENRISKQAADEAYRSGRQARAAGVRCDCHECKAIKIPICPICKLPAHASETDDNNQHPECQ
jgi:hypothetical protein